MKKEEISYLHKSSPFIKQIRHKSNRFITVKILNKPEMHDENVEELLLEKLI